MYMIPHLMIQEHLFQNQFQQYLHISGVSSSSTVKSYASSGGVAHGSSRIPHSFALPHKFWSIENGLSKLIGIGMFFSFAYSISSSLDQPHSRTGAKTCKFGFKCLQ